MTAIQFFAQRKKSPSPLPFHPELKTAASKNWKRLNRSIFILLQEYLIRLVQNKPILVRITLR